MQHLGAKIGRLSVILLVLTAGVSAQRYTGHDHAVFHRPPSTPSPAAKHQSATASSAAKTSPKSGNSPGTVQSVTRSVPPASSGTGGNQPPAPASVNSSAETPP